MAHSHATSHDPRIGAPAAVLEAQTATGPQRGAPPADKGRLAVRCINTIRTLAMDAVQQANSGHPGTPMALAPVAFVLWDRHLRHNPANPQWPNRDRFMLSNGHASMLLYVWPYLTQHSNNNAYCAVALFALTGLPLSDDIGALTVGAVQHMDDHCASPSCGCFGSFHYGVDHSTSTPLKHLQSRYITADPEPRTVMLILRHLPTIRHYNYQ